MGGAGIATIRLWRRRQPLPRPHLEILKRFTGSDAFGASTTIDHGSLNVEPGMPAAPVTLSWATFSAAADEAGMSRRYGGIHFEDADVEGRKLGRKVGAIVWETGRRYIDGTAR